MGQGDDEVHLFAFPEERDDPSGRLDRVGENDGRGLGHVRSRIAAHKAEQSDLHSRPAQDGVGDHGDGVLGVPQPEEPGIQGIHEGVRGDDRRKPSPCVLPGGLQCLGQKPRPLLEVVVAVSGGVVAEQSHGDEFPASALADGVEHRTHAEVARVRQEGPAFVAGPFPVDDRGEAGEASRLGRFAGRVQGRVGIEVGVQVVGEKEDEVLGLAGRGRGGNGTRPEDGRREEEKDDGEIFPAQVRPLPFAVETDFRLPSRNSPAPVFPGRSCRRGSRWRRRWPSRIST